MLSPERSRNAKAQARHRAKRKAYIDHLEQNVQKLQLALGISDEQVNELESPYARIRQLEIEVEELKKEIVALRTKQSTGFSQDVEDQQPLCSPEAEVRYTHRETEQDFQGVPVGDAHGAACHSSLLRPHPLTITASTATGHPTQYSATIPSATESTSYSTHPPTSSIYQMSPHTPSSSGESSTPPFSPTSATQYHQHTPVDVVGARSRHNSAVAAYHHNAYASSVKDEDRSQAHANYSVPSHHHQHLSRYSAGPTPEYVHVHTEQHLRSWSYRDDRSDYPHYHSNGLPNEG